MSTLEKIRAEIDEQTEIHSDGEFYIKNIDVKRILAKYAEQEPRLWNNHQVACLLADMFGDNCACNFNGIDEWLPELCDFKDNCCPNPVGAACWEQFLKHSRARYCECGYEMR